MAELYERIYERFITDPGQLEDMAFRDLVVDRDAIPTNMLTQHEKYLKWGMLVAIAEAKFNEEQRLIVEEIWPRARRLARKTLESVGTKPTEGAIEEEAYGDEDFLTASRRRAKHRFLADILKKVESAAWQRKDMLMGLNSRQKSELSGYPHDTPWPQERENESPPKKESKLGDDLQELMAKAKEVIQKNRSKG